MALKEGHNVEVVHYQQGMVGKEYSTLLQNLLVGEQGYNILSRQAANEYNL